MNVINAIEGGIVTAFHMVVDDAEKFFALVVQDAKPVLKQAEAEVYADLRAVIAGILVAFQGKDLPTIEAGLLNTLGVAESALLAEAQALGSAVLQFIIADVRAAAA